MTLEERVDALEKEQKRLTYNAQILMYAVWEDDVPAGLK